MRRHPAGIVGILPRVAPDHAGCAAVVEASDRAERRPGARARSADRAAALSRGVLRVDVVAIGSSIGGPNALAEVFKTLPRLSVPVVISSTCLRCSRGCLPSA